MKKQGETELLKGQSTPAQTSNLNYHSAALRDVPVHFLLCLYEATQSLPLWIEPTLFVWNLVAVVTSHVELGQVLVVGYSDSLLYGYLFYALLTWGTLFFAGYAYLEEKTNSQIACLRPAYKAAATRQTTILALCIMLQAYICTPRILTTFMLLLVNPSHIWPNLLGDSLYWAHLASTGVSAALGIALAFVYLSYCKLPIPGRRDLFSSTSVFNEAVMVVIPFYAFMTTSFTKELFIMRRASPFLVVMLHLFKSAASYAAILANLSTVTFYNRPARDVLTWMHMLTITFWAMAIFMTDVSPKWDKLLALLICLLGPLIISSFLRIAQSLDTRVTNTNKLSAVVALAEVCLLEAAGKLHPLEGKKAEYLKNFYFHQEKIQKLAASTPRRLSEPERLIIAVFESLLTRSRAKSFEGTMFYLYYLTRIDAGVLLPTKLLKKLAADAQKRTLKHRLLFRVIARDLQDKLNTITFEQELLKVGKTDFSSMDCSPINPHLALQSYPVGRFSQTNLEALLLFDRLTESMTAQIKNLKEFFVLLSQSECDVSTLHRSAEALHSGQSKCQSIFSLLDCVSPKSNSFHLLPFAMFAHHTNNNNRLMRDILHMYHLRKKADGLIKFVLPFLTVKEHSSVFVASADPTDLGFVKYACGQKDKLIGRTNEENIFNWLPESFEAAHRNTVLDYLSAMDVPYLGMRQDRLLKLPNSSVYAQNQMISLFGPSLLNGLQFVVCTERHLQPAHLILFDSHFQVSGLSESLAELGPNFCSSLLKRQAREISPFIPTLLNGQGVLDPQQPFHSKKSAISASGTTALTPSEISDPLLMQIMPSLAAEGEMFLAFGHSFYVPCKAKDLSCQVLALPDKRASKTKSTLHVLTVSQEVFTRLTKSLKKSVLAQKTFNMQLVTIMPRVKPLSQDRHPTFYATVLVALFVGRLKSGRSLLRKFSPLSWSRDADSVGNNMRGLHEGEENQKPKKEMLTDKILAKLDNRFAKPSKEDMEAADSINTHRQIMYDTRSLTIRHISPKSTILWAVLSLGLVILLFWAGMIYCYWLEIIYMGNKAAILLDARLVQSLLVISRWSVWQMIDGVVEKVCYDQKLVSPSRFVDIGLSNYRNWKDVYDEGSKRWPLNQVNYLLQLEKLPESSIDTINQFVYVTNITLGPGPKDYLTKRLTLNNILYYVSFQVRMLYDSLPKVQLNSTAYAKTITLIEDGSPATVSKYADQIVVVEGNKFTDTQAQISTTVTAIMLVSEGFLLGLFVLGWLVSIRICEVYQTFTLLEDREIQFKKERLEHLEALLIDPSQVSVLSLISTETKSKGQSERKPILTRKTKRLQSSVALGFGSWPLFLGLLLCFQASLLAVIQLSSGLGILFDVQNQATTNFRSFGKMMYQHRAAYHMIFDAVLIKAGIGKNVTITAQLTKLNNVINNMKSFQSDMEKFYRQNKLSSVGRQYTNIQMIFNPCAMVDVSSVGITFDACSALADGTMGQDFMAVMNWAISTTDNFMNLIRNIPKEKALSLFSQQSYLNLEFLVKKFYYVFYQKFAASFKSSIKAATADLVGGIGETAWILILLSSLVGLYLSVWWGKFIWGNTSCSLNSLKYLPQLSLHSNAHLKLKLKKYNPKYV